MFLLFLIGLGTANVNAQVRIGGNAVPNGGAVLDLNATDAATGTKGLALPRVRLDSAKMQITPGVTNLNGMMVYNTTATLGAGIYFWNGATWVKANLPSISAADSGKFLVSNGSSLVLGFVPPSALFADTLRLNHRDTIAWIMVLDTTIYPFKYPNGAARILIPGLTAYSICSRYAGSYNPIFSTGVNQLWITDLTINQGYNGTTGRISFRCYVPSL